MGGILSERSGVVNIALDGFILTGAFFGAWAGQNSALEGLAAALLAGAMLGLLHAVLTQKTHMNHVVSGLGINLLAAGATRYLSFVYFPGGITSQEIDPRIYLVIAAVLPFAIAFLLRRTRFGLRLRAVGENPESVRMAGITVVPIRILAVTLSGVFAALAGTFLSLGETQTFSRDMSAGKGYIALAAVIFGKWNPAGATVAALFFGLFYAVQTQMQISGIHLTWFGVEWSSPFLLDTLPYLMTIAALVSVVGRAMPPASLGKEDA
jgi:simple sugar transport system permease protein